MVAQSSKKEAFYGTGRRKTATARVWLFKGEKGFTINGNQHQGYLNRPDILTMVEQPLQTSNLLGQFRVRVRVAGGGVAGQAGAVRLGVARALVAYDASLKSAMRQAGFMTRDPREKERKKPGRKGARRRFQYTKR